MLRLAITGDYAYCWSYHVISHPKYNRFIKLELSVICKPANWTFGIFLEELNRAC